MKEWTDKNLFDRIKSLWTELDEPYKRLSDARETICERFRPDLDIEIGSSYDSRLLGHDIYDSTGVYALNTMVVAFQSLQYSKSLDWQNYKMRQTLLQDIDELDIFCGEIKDHLSQVYQRGNFYETQRPYGKNALSIGSPCSFAEEDIKTGEIMWIPLHYKTFRLYYDRYNRVSGVIVKDKWSVKNVYDKFCKGRTAEIRQAKAKKIFSSILVRQIEAGQWEEKVTIYRAVFKKSHPLFYGKNFGLQYEWWGCYFEDDPDSDKKDKPLESEGYFSKPFVVWDYEKNPWETASRTPAFNCLYDDVTLSQIMFNYVTNTQLKARPPKAVLAENKGKGSLNPGDNYYLERSQWEYKPEKMDVTGDLRWEKDQLEMFRDNVNRHYHVKLFNLITEIAFSQSNYMPIMQILEIKGEKINQISPILESNENYLRQVSERVMDIEIRAGRGPFRRENLEYIAALVRWNCERLNIEFDGEIIPEFSGELQQQQQTERKLRPIRMMLALSKEFMESIDPVLPPMVIRSYDTFVDGLQAVGFDMKDVNTKEQYEESRAQYDQAQADQLQFENMVEAAKATKGAKPVESREVPLIEGQTA